MTTTELEAQVDRGHRWLAEHDSDPGGRFYLWWAMGIRPTDPMPRQPEEVRKRYAEWHRGFERWLTLWCQLSGDNRTELIRWMRSVRGQAALVQEARA